MKRFFFALLTLTHCFNAYSSSWNELEILTPDSNNQTIDDKYGHDIAIDGEYAVVGAYGHNNDKGIVYLYHFNGTSWDLQAKLTASNAAFGDKFGSTVDISGETIIVGAYSKDIGATGSAGTVYIFEKPQNGWTDTTETAKLTSSDTGLGYAFGTSVSIDGNEIAVGRQAGAAGNEIVAYVFSRPQSGWVDMTETAKLSRSDYALYNGDFGWSISISGDVIAVGSFTDKQEGDLAGSAYVYVKPPSGWVSADETGKLTASDAGDFHQFGIDVAVSGDIITIGAPEARNQGIGTGAVYVFEKPSNGWVTMNETAKLVAGDGAQNDYFGVDLDIEGNKIVVGAKKDDDAGSSTGSIYYFEKPTNGWTNTTENQKINASDQSSGREFGKSVAVSGNHLFTAAIKDNGSSNTSGKCYAFKTDNPTSVLAKTVTNGITLYPNPTSGTVNIQSKDEIEAIQIADMNGRVVSSFSGNIKAFDISELNSGMYSVLITTKTNTVVDKLIKH